MWLKLLYKEGGHEMNPLNTITGTLVAGVVMAVAIAFGTSLAGASMAGSIIILSHVAAGVVWIGLLYYFNFVQVPGLAAAAADEGGPGPAAISKYIVPTALLWFRWAALATWLTGATYLMITGELINAFTLTGVYGITIGVGAWCGTVMLFNVWILIWPNQKKALGMVEATPEAIAKGKRIAFLASRTNTLLSIPMLMSMVGAHHGYFM
ncbi:MAG: putative membrane protein [Gammaproteobacteria bacterium]|jgi:uncharacterized membrane protein|tara:strand:- start:544 stop:1170 length:627 start_codon:yes stop_codon:yes gene_type:complete